MLSLHMDDDMKPFWILVLQPEQHLRLKRAFLRIGRTSCLRNSPYKVCNTEFVHHVSQTFYLPPDVLSRSVEFEAQAKLAPPLREMAPNKKQRVSKSNAPASCISQISEVQTLCAAFINEMHINRNEIPLDAVPPPQEKPCPIGTGGSFMDIVERVKHDKDRAKLDGCCSVGHRAHPASVKSRTLCDTCANGCAGF